jgi:hypothetical protein
MDFAAVSRAARRRVMETFSVDALSIAYESLFSIGPVRKQTNTKELEELTTIPLGLHPNFPGIALQGKHLMADIWRRLVHGKRMVVPEQTE